MTDEYTDVDPLVWDYGVLPPEPGDYETQAEYNAAYESWRIGFMAYLEQRRKVEALEEQQMESQQAAAEEADAVQDVGQLPVDESGAADRYVVGSYIDAAGNIWSPIGELLSGDGALMDSYVDQAGHKWTMEYSRPMEEEQVQEVQPQMEGDVVTGDPTIDTALLLLDLYDALTGEDGMTEDVDGMQQVLDHPLMTTSFQDYTVTEGLLLLILLCVFMAACAKMLKEGFAWLR